MTLLFRRAARVVVGTIELVVDPQATAGSSLDLSFDVESSLKPEPNTAEIAIRNLNRVHRSQLEEASNVPCTVDAGYEQRIVRIFSGVLRTVTTERDGATLTTTIASGDGEKRYQQSRINVSVARGTTNSSLIRRLVQAMQIGEGNLSLVSAQLDAAPAYLPQGGVLSGSASQITTRVAQSLGFEWSIQGGLLTLLRVSEPLQQTATLLRSVGGENTGLVGTPSVDNKGILSARTLLIPDIFPGRLIVLESERLTGSYRVEKCKYSGDTAGQEWYIDLEGRKI